MNIVGIERITYGVADLALAARFHRDWGLECVEQGEAGCEFRLPNDTTIALRRADDGALPPATIDWAPLNDSTAREVVWGVDNAATLDAIGAELGRDRDVRRDNRGVLRTVDDDGYHIGFMVTERTTPKSELPATNSVLNFGRLNRPADGTVLRKVGPARMGHVVYWSPRDHRRAARFYIERLGFRLTDDMSRGGLFMRCAGAADHHSLLLQGGTATGFQHVAYEFRDFDEVMLLGTQVEAGGWKTNVGPLRHNVSSSMSWYIWNPAGGLSEAYSDMDCVDDAWVPRVFRPGEDPAFYGSSWRARPEQKGVGPAHWKDEHTAPAFPQA
jgi:hypothetical protein